MKDTQSMEEIADEKENRFIYYLPDIVRQYKYNGKFFCVCTGGLSDDSGGL